MNPSKKVSIIVPCYNCADKVSNCLSMIQEQSYDNIEVICVNDGSKDSTAEKIKPFLLDKRFHLINQNNQHTGMARNTGMARAQGQYLTFIDSDDWILPNYIKHLVAGIEKTDADICRCLYTQLLSDGTSDRLVKSNIRPKIEDALPMFSGKISNMATCRLYKTAFLRENNLTFASKRLLHEDLAFTYKAYYHAKSLSYMDYTGYMWCKRNESLSSNYTLQHLEDTVWIIRDAFNFFLHHQSLQHFGARLVFLWVFIFEKFSLYPPTARMKAYLINELKKDPRLQISATMERQMRGLGLLTLYTRLEAGSARFPEIRSWLLGATRKIKLPSPKKSTLGFKIVKILNVLGVTHRKVPTDVTFRYLFSGGIILMQRYFKRFL